ncbi:hypothetical protein L204_100723 [Cryptococcus depauperatus]
MSEPSSQQTSYQPYVPRKQRSLRPERPLPLPPPDELASPPKRLASLTITDSPLPQPLATAPLDAIPPAHTAIPPPKSAPAAIVSKSHLHPFHSTLSALTDHSTELTPLRAHYLKKTLVNLQVKHELSLITDPVLGANALGLLGDPFVFSEQARRHALERVSQVAREEGQLSDLPFLRFMFHQFLLPFPFLASAPPSFWSAKVQPFLSSFLATTGMQQHTTQTDQERQTVDALMTKEELKEAQERKKLWNKAEKHLALVFGLGIKLTSGEEIVRIGQAELRRLEQLQQDRERQFMKTHGGRLPGDPRDTMFEVNVIGVRLVVEKGRVRSRSHEEFIVRTSRSGVSDVHVSRRYGDFRRLAEELRLAFPDSPIPFPPPKDKSSTNASTPSTGYSAYNPLRVWYGSNSPPGSAASDEPESPNSTTSTSTISLLREKNRLTLRAYLNALLSMPFVVESPILRSFLLSGPMTLTPQEVVDCQRRLSADAVREEGRRRFKAEAEKRIEALREGLTQFKGDVLQKEGGLKNVFEVVKRVERVEHLPKAEASVLEWGRISFAATIFQLFVASDTASDTFATLKRLHGLMPYFVLKGILKISNPMAMIRGVLDLFLARPFGGQSLIQRMFSSSLTEDVRMLEEDIEVVQEKIDDPVLCQKIRQFAEASFEIQNIYRKDAAAEGLDLLVVILRSPEVPCLSRPQFQRVARATRAYKEYKAVQAELSDSDDDDGPENEDAWLYEDLTILLKLWIRKKEKEGLLALIFEGVTAELLKDIITIFYTPLAQVYKAASIADSLGDMQAFINDMIRTVEQVEELSQDNPSRTVQTFIDLVQRHEQSFYTFVHNVHSKGQGLFDSLMSWLEIFLNYARTGLTQSIDLEFILPYSKQERERIFTEIDAVAMYHYKLKVAHEERIRRRFRHAGDANSPGGTDSGAIGEGLEDDAELFNTILSSLSISEAVIGEAGDLGVEDESEEEEEDESVFAERDEKESDSSSLISPRLLSQTQNQNQSQVRPRSVSTSNPTGNATLPDDTVTKDRRSSHSLTSNSLRKVRSTLRIRHGAGEEGNQSHEGEREPRHKSSPGKRPLHSPYHYSPRSHSHTYARRTKKKKGMAEALTVPETEGIESLRPLFVEVLRPNLRIWNSLLNVYIEKFVLFM